MYVEFFTKCLWLYCRESLGNNWKLMMGINLGYRFFFQFIIIILLLPRWLLEQIHLSSRTIDNVYTTTVQYQIDDLHSK